MIRRLYERFVPRNERALARVFFGRLFENDFFSSSSAATSNLIFLLALVAVPGVMISAGQSFTWAHLRATGRRLSDPMIVDRALMAYQSFYIAVAMAVAFVLTMMVWTSLTPDRKDALVLGPLPVSRREQAHGRLLALLKFFGLFAAAVSVPTAVAFNFVSGGPETVTSLPHLIAGHIAASILGCAFVFFLLLNLQLLVAAAFGPRAVRFLTLPLQLASILAVIAALAAAQDFGRALLSQAPAGTPWHPLAWFAGIYRWIGGDDRAIFAALAARGAIASAVLIGVALTMYPVAYDRCLRQVITMDGRSSGAISRRWTALSHALLRPPLRSPLQRSLASFMLATLTRSHTHRFLLGLYLGLALLIALPIADRLALPPDTNTLRYAWFAIPLGFMFWSICGTRVALMMPIEPAANWIFQLTEPVDKRRLLTTVVTVMACVTCVPIAGLTAAVLLMLGHTTLAGTVFLIVVLAGLCQIEALTMTMKTVPFTCTYLPGQLRLRLFWPFYFYLWLTVVFRLTEWGLWALGDARRTLQLAGFLLTVWAALRVWHLARAKKINSFTYDEQPPALVTTMEIATQLKRT